jgi:hypothetical protein
MIPDVCCGRFAFRPSRCGLPQSLAGGTRVPVLRDGIHAVAPHGQMLPRFGSTTHSSS